MRRAAFSSLLVVEITVAPAACANCGKAALEF